MNGTVTVLGKPLDRLISAHAHTGHYNDADRVDLGGAQGDGRGLLVVNFRFQPTDPVLPFDGVRVHVR
ncbi:hypothetical protein DF268_06335 [Streptomyces sp. V2]|uniref:hypothetical protein n=1 Tax=Streptomyces TaxID=1883 RepID=UPI00099EAABB|nr:MULTISPECIES: hypothetical protein [Streptomyces]PWG14487.1 hypothetical protein DF268_06335 [Streptomyces sp. V2]